MCIFATYHLTPPKTFSHFIAILHRYFSRHHGSTVNFASWLHAPRVCFQLFGYGVRIQCTGKYHSNVTFVQKFCTPGCSNALSFFQSPLCILSRGWGIHLQVKALPALQWNSRVALKNANCLNVMQCRQNLPKNKVLSVKNKILFNFTAWKSKYAFSINKLYIYWPVFFTLKALSAVW